MATVLMVIGWLVLVAGLGLATLALFVYAYFSTKIGTVSGITKLIGFLLTVLIACLWVQVWAISPFTITFGA